MSQTKKIFYNLFWQNKACQNLFLLSKEELLDTIKVNVGETPVQLSLPRIILSNVEKKEDDNYQTLRLRTENSNIKTENILANNIERYTPLLTNFLENKFGKSLEKFVVDVEKKPLKLIKRVFSLMNKDEKEIENTIIEFLQEYGFIGKHLKSFKEIGDYFDNEFISKNVKSIVTENNIWNFLEFLKSIKDVYVNESYKSLYNSNQILVNALYNTDDFISRLQLFSLLYEGGIIAASKEDAFVECLNCEPGTYKGVLQLSLNPKKLKNLICPICQSELTYYVPYKLHDDIYSLVKLKDGLLHNALCELLNANQILFNTNVKFLNDIEIDCAFNHGGIEYFIECKMYKVSSTRERLTNKIRKHFGKLYEDITRVCEAEKIMHSTTQIILLVNLVDNELLNNIELELKKNYTDDLALNAKIININHLNSIIKK